MPYITRQDADLLDGDRIIGYLVDRITTGGQLNYTICKLAMYFFLKQPQHNYETIKSVLGDIMLAADEFKHRVLREYETEKMEGLNNADPFAETITEWEKENV